MYVKISIKMHFGFVLKGSLSNKFCFHNHKKDFLHIMIPFDNLPLWPSIGRHVQ